MTAKPNWTPTILQQLDLARQNLEARERQLRAAHRALQDICKFINNLAEGRVRPSVNERRTIMTCATEALREIHKP